MTQENRLLALAYNTQTPWNESASAPTGCCFESEDRHVDKYSKVIQ